MIAVVSSNSLPVFQNAINRLKLSVANECDVPVLAAHYLSPQRQKLCRDNDVYYMDLSGNMYLAYRSVYVEKVGFPNKFPEKRRRRSPFSDKASLILRELLKKGTRQWGIRELAQNISLNPGYVSRMAGSLEEFGYLSRTKGKLRIRSQREILDDWVSAYDLKKNDLNRFFYMAANVEAILERLRNLQIPPDTRYALSVQAGASLVAPHAVFKEVHVYVKDSRGLEFFKRQMDLKDSAQGANFVLMLPYYKHSVFYDHRMIDGLSVVSDIQLYLDLHGYPVRGREQAEYLYDKRLKTYFGE
jgi:DNA-binding transcriptional regulator YhcF (GntR family)